MKTMMMKYLAVLITMCAANIIVSAQSHDGVFTTGLRIGANHVAIANLKQTFCADDNQPLYELSEKRHITPTVSIVAQYRFPISLVAVEGNISYCQTRNEIEKTTTHNTETYDIKLNHIMLSAGAKVYPVKGAFAKATIGAGPCLNSSTCVKYDATGVTNAAKMQVEEHISQTVKGRTLVRADLALGYDFPMGLTVEAFYGKCLVDLLEVGINGYGFSEQRNDSQYIGMGVGWQITKNGFQRRQ